MIAILRGLTVTLQIFHSGDEFNYHYPTILQFSRELPFPDLARYPAAQTPLFHVLMAYVGQVTGYELYRLRLVEALLSYLLVLAVYELLRRRAGLDQLTAVALALLFELSPYVFGTSFRVITDNLATLCAVLALDRFERARETGSLRTFAMGSAAAGAAILTRQSAGFMFAVGAVYLLALPISLRARAVAAGTLVLAAAPAIALFLSWHSLVNPGGDPSSCGLCSGGGGGAGTGLTWQTPELALATFGLYGAVLFGPELIDRVRRRGGVPLAAMAAAALLAGALLLAAPAHSAHEAGLLWSASHHGPAIDGTALVFWVLAPLGAAVLAWRAVEAPKPWLLLAFALCFLVSSAVIRYPWQKYVDPFVLLALFLSVRRQELASAWRLAGAGVLAAGFIVYTADTSAHKSVPHRTPAALVAPAVRPSRL
jgi:4-amino-4-deoxy-L-arabinose transferase-like glycosyltransferase